ncbi:hypothetical protein [Streptomyces sp. B1I3]|uniref:hypothetical protein n=1 Tax=Streptomyces sp. B1I3 TaxID=3042264 RepID=UPI00278072D9|nr:hypothetical protein [Streptomyces sp. B1I3]MDQ0795378.1 hypothetical protein [Streptomyces sp. B1I3]
MPDPPDAPDEPDPMCLIHPMHLMNPIQLINPIHPNRPALGAERRCPTSGTALPDEAFSEREST